MKEYFAADLGASNGRTILGRFNGKILTLSELSRFENSYVRVGEAYYWDILRLYTNLLGGMKQYTKNYRGELNGIGIDTWGVDFGLIDKQGRLLGNPRSYRDPYCLRGMTAFHQEYGDRTLFDITGIANLEFNTIYQLFDMVQHRDPQLTKAGKLLLLPDLLGYMLSSEIAAEYSHATTTQMLGLDGNWSEHALDMAGITRGLLPAVQRSGTMRGKLLTGIQDETGLKTATPVFAVGAHDTASAVASIPVKDENFAFISSGTWSLIGIIADRAILGDEVYNQQFSNEGTVDGRYRLLRNIMGLWIIQNCRQEWEREGRVSWDDIVELAGKAPPFGSFINVNEHQFYTADNMIQKICRYCEETGQHVPQTIGEIARAVYESLAMSYREAFKGLEMIKGARINVMHIVGGGSQNKLLNQMTANAIGRHLIAGPTEATAIGNLMVQIKASGEVKDWSEMRQVICDSFEVETYKPHDTDAWAEHFEGYTKIKSLNKGQ